MIMRVGLVRQRCLKIWVMWLNRIQMGKDFLGFHGSEQDVFMVIVAGKLQGV